MTSSNLCHVVKQEPSEPEEYLPCVTKDGPDSFSTAQVNVDTDGCKLRQGDFEKGYCYEPQVKFECCDNAPRDDSLAIEPNIIKQEIMLKEELNIVDEKEMQTSSNLCHVVKQEPSEPEEYLPCVTKDGPDNFSTAQVNVDTDGCKLRQGDFEKGYCYEPQVKFECCDNAPRDDPLAFEPNLIKQEIVQKEELHIVDEEEMQETIGEDYHFSSARENLLDFTSQMYKALTLTMGSANTNTVNPGNNELVNQCTPSSYNSGYACDLMGKRTKVTAYKCTLCPFNSRLADDLRTHVMTIHAKGKPYKCTQCPFRASWTDGLKRHMKTHRNENKPYKCALCLYSSKYEDGLESHMKTHNENKPYKCNLCPFSSKYENSLKVHMKTHNENKPYKCTLCPFSSKYVQSLNSHMKTHNENKPYKCTLCPFSSKQEQGLKSHMKTHNENKPYKCTLCPFSSRYQTSLKSHMKTHNENKPYKCTLCLFSSKYETNLKRHIMQTHNENKPYKCNLCPFSSRYETSLKVHMKTHSGLAPFQCTLCPFSTVWAASLKGHMDKHRRDKTDNTFQCAHCSQRFSGKLCLTKHIKKRHMVDMENILLLNESYSCK